MLYNLNTTSERFNFKFKFSKVTMALGQALLLVCLFGAIWLPVTVSLEASGSGSGSDSGSGPGSGSGSGSGAESGFYNNSGTLGHANRIKDKLTAVSRATGSSLTHAALNHKFSTTSVTYGAYQFIPSLDNVGNDIKQASSTRSTSAIQSECDNSLSPLCVAYNAGGWLKRGLSNPSSWYTSSTPGLYIKTLDTLYFGNSLSYTAGNYLRSPSGSASFVAQADSNLVIYNVATNTALWATNTNGHSPAIVVLTMQTDCNLVAYSADNVARWASNTNGQGDRCYVRIFDNGNLAIFDGNNNQRWQTNTGVITPPAANIPSNLNTVCTTVNTYTHLSAGDLLMQGINQITGGHYSFSYSFPVIPNVGVDNGQTILNNQAKCNSAPLNPTTNYVYMTLGSPSLSLIQNSQGAGSNGASYNIGPNSDWAVCIATDPCDGSFFLVFNDISIDAGVVEFSPSVIALSPTQNIAYTPSLQLWLGNEVTPNQPFLQDASFNANLFLAAELTVPIPPVEGSPLQVHVTGKAGVAWTNAGASYGDLFSGAAGAWKFGLDATAQLHIAASSTGIADIAIPFTAQTAVLMECTDSQNCGVYVGGSIDGNVNSFLASLNINIIPTIDANVGAYFFYKHSSSAGESWGLLFDASLQVAGYSGAVYAGLSKRVGQQVELCFASTHGDFSNGNCLEFGCAKHSQSRSYSTFVSWCNPGDSLDSEGITCWVPCPSGYTAIAGVCWEGISNQIQQSYSALRCPSGYENDAGTCYSTCPSGYQGVGPICYQNCPAAYSVDTGLFCNIPGGIQFPTSMCPQ